MLLCLSDVLPSRFRVGARSNKSELVHPVAQDEGKASAYPRPPKTSSKSERVLPAAQDDFEKRALSGFDGGWSGLASYCRG